MKMEIIAKQEYLDILKRKKVELPAWYIDFLVKNESSLNVKITRKKNKFRLYNLRELCENINSGELKDYLIIGYENKSYLVLDSRDMETLWIVESSNLVVSKTKLKLKDITKKWRRVTWQPVCCHGFWDGQ